MDEFLLDLVEILEDNEEELKRMLLGLCNLLQDNGCGKNLFTPELIKLLSSPMSERLEKIPPVSRQVDGKLLMTQLLSIGNDILHGQKVERILKLLDGIQRLLESEEPQKRRVACLLMCKMELVCRHGGAIGQSILDAMQCYDVQLYYFVRIVESLHMKEVDLAVNTIREYLPALGLLYSDIGERWSDWLRILCLRLLQDDRMPVLLQTLKYFLEQSGYSQLCRFNLLHKFLLATNRNELYDHDESDYLMLICNEPFLKAANMEVFINVFMEIPWKGVPLHLWLSRMWCARIPIVSKEQLQMLCSRIRAINNSELRQSTIFQTLTVFKATIEKLTLADYMNIIEFVYNKNTDKKIRCERFLPQMFDILQTKMEACTNFADYIHLFDKNFYELLLNVDEHPEIASRVFGYNTFYKTRLFPIFIRKVQTIPKENHGWWRLSLFQKEVDNDIMDFYRTVYNVDTSLVLTSKSLQKIQQHLIDKLGCQTFEEKSFLKSRCVDLFVKINIEYWNDLKDCKLNPMEILSQGNDDTFQHLISIIGTAHKFEDENVLPALVSRVRYIHESACILLYALDNLDVKERENCILSLCQTNDFEIEMCQPMKLSYNFTLGMILRGDILTGDERIEAAYVFEPEHNIQCFRQLFLANAYDDNELDVNKMCDELLSMNSELSKNNRNYLENSNVHRRKIRIATALITLHKRWKWSDKLWKALLCPNDLLGINMMFEFLVALMLPSIKALENQLKLLATLKATQQESLLSVTYIYIHNNFEQFKDKKLVSICTLLQPLTTSASYQTAVLARTILYELATMCTKKQDRLEAAAAIKGLIQENDPRYTSESRLLLTKISLDYDKLFCCIDDLLYLTNAPFGEHTKKNMNFPLRTRGEYRARYMRKKIQN